jgi:hypothetical protein
MKVKSQRPKVKPTPAVKLDSLSDILTLDEVGAVLRTSRRSVYGLTRSRAQLAENPLKILRLPIGLRVRRVDLENWLAAA